MIPILLLFITTTDKIVKTVDFDMNSLIIQQDLEYTKIRFPGYEISDEVAAPEVPVKAIKIALPYGAKITNINILSKKETEVDGKFLLSYTQPPVILSQKDVKKYIEPNDAIYSSDKPYPENIIELKGTAVYDNYQICELLVYPVQYLPKSKRLIFFNSIKFSVEYEGGVKKTTQRNTLKTIVINPEDVTTVSTSRQSSDFDYLIITNPPMDTVFERLADWKTKKGIKTELRTVNWILANYSGEDNAACIRNYLKTLPDSNVQYVLLAGDTDVIPCRFAYAMTCSAFIWNREDSLPCDLYYADLQGDWNFDGDGLYGEVEDSIDLYPDLFVGRATVNTISEAQNFVDRILTYEKNPPLDYLNNAMFSADILWYNPYTDQGVHKNMIEAESFPLDFEITKLYHSQGNLSVSSFLNAIEQGQNLVNHDGHGSTTVMGAGTGYLHLSDFDNLTNAPRYGILASIGCWTAAFDFDAIAEHWVNSPNGGGVAFIGNSSYGWGSPGNPGFGYSDRFDSRIFYSLFKEDNFHLGAALSLSKAYFIPYSREKNVFRWHQYQLNLLGDPEMPVWTDIPETLVVSYPQSIPLGSSRILITVKDKNSDMPIKDALVCLMKGSESYAPGYTDASGSIFLDATPSTLGDCDLTVTAHNYIVVETTIPVISGSYVNYLGWIINDTAGNSDGIANPNENILLTITLKNCGNASANNIQLKLRSQDAFVTIQDSTESLTSLAAGDSIVIDDAFEITVGAGSNGHGISFDLEISDASNTLNFSPIILISTPILSIDEVIIAQPPSMPNETESLFVNIENSGYGFGHSSFAKLISNDSNVSIITDSVWYGEIYPESLNIASHAFVVSIDPGCPSSYLAQLPITIYTDDYNFNDTIGLLIGETGFSDNMESGSGLWTTGGTNNLWHISTTRYFSPTHSWYCGDSITYQYNNNMDCYIQTIPFMINANSILKFYRWFDVPLYGTDGIYIMGDGYADTLDFIGTGGALGGRGIQSDWFEEEYSLSEYPAGETIQVRIAFISDGGDGVGEGFYIDDFVAEYITMIQEYTADRTEQMFLRVHPNPFRHNIDIEYCIGHGVKGIGQSARRIELKIYDVGGRLVKEFNLQSEICNLQSVKWSGTDQLNRPVAAGVYFVQLKTTEHCLTRKAILLR
ncbi:hypothetical protein ES705_13913 [subsurface metagenome]